MINSTRDAGSKIIAVGTTSVRSLESAAIASKIRNRNLKIKPSSGNTNLYILPGYKFKLVDAIITNFHLPRSTLIMMVSAFAGKKEILSAYELAVQEKYRFYSFGDAMLIL